MTKEQVIELFQRRANLENSIAERAVSKSVKTEHMAKSWAFREASDILKEKLDE